MTQRRWEMVSASARRKKEKAVIEAAIAGSAAAAASAGGGGGGIQVWEDYEEDSSRVDGGWFVGFCCVFGCRKGDHSNPDQSRTLKPSTRYEAYLLIVEPRNSDEAHNLQVSYNVAIYRTYSYIARVRANVCT